MNDYTRRLVHPISHHGVIIEVVLDRIGGLFTGLKVSGLIDTGATDIVISQNLANRLSLKHINDTTMEAVGGGSVDCRVYSGRIKVPELEFDRIVPLHAVNWQQKSHTVLLGREFLRHFMLNYDGPREMFNFSTPLEWLRETPESLDG